jgi:hypothetical protein
LPKVALVREGQKDPRLAATVANAPLLLDRYDFNDLPFLGSTRRLPGNPTASVVVLKKLRSNVPRDAAQSAAILSDVKLAGGVSRVSGHRHVRLDSMTSKRRG